MSAEEDEVFMRKTEQQDKRREKNEPQLISKPPEEVSSNNLELLRLKFEKNPIVLFWEQLIDFVLFKKTTMKTKCFIEPLSA